MHRCNSSGHVWLGRFKVFPVQPDEDNLTVLSYLKRQSRRANLTRIGQTSSGVMDPSGGTDFV